MVKIETINLDSNENKLILFELEQILISKLTEFLQEKEFYLKIILSEIDIKIQYKPEFNKIYFTLNDTSEIGTTLVFNLIKKSNEFENNSNFFIKYLKSFLVKKEKKLSELYEIKNIDKIDDIENFFSATFYVSGYKNISKKLGNFKVNKIKERIYKLQNDKVNLEFISKFKTNHNNYISVTSSIIPTKEDIFVNQKNFKFNSREIGLYTSALFTCSGLIIDNFSTKTHFLGHFDANISQEEIIKYLKEYSDSRSLIYLIGGTEGNTVLNTIFFALIKNNSNFDNIKLIRNSKDSYGSKIYIKNGILYSPK